MIRAGGLEDYYRRQDRVGQPLGEEPFCEVDAVFMEKLQHDAELSKEYKIALGVHGMSCAACAWLIEQLARRQAGVVYVRVTLESNNLQLRWEGPDFDLRRLAQELQKFGYRITGELGLSAARFSPMAVRCGLTALFSLNGLLLGAALKFGVAGADLDLLLKMLIVACLYFSLQIGGMVFLRPAWGALSMGRLHRDLPIAAIFVVLFILSIVSLFLLRNLWFINILYFTLLGSAVAARWFLEGRAMTRAQS